MKAMITGRVSYTIGVEVDDSISEDDAFDMLRDAVYAPGNPVAEALSEGISSAPYDETPEVEFDEGAPSCRFMLKADGEIGEM